MMNKFFALLASSLLLSGCGSSSHLVSKPSLYDLYKPIQNMTDPEMRYENAKQFYAQHCTASKSTCIDVLRDWIAYDFEKKNYSAVLAQASKLALHKSTFEDCTGVIVNKQFLSLSEIAYQSHVALKQKEQAKPYFHKMHECRIVSSYYSTKTKPEGWAESVLKSIKTYENEVKTVDPQKKEMVRKLSLTFYQLSTAEQRIRSKEARVYKPDPVMLNAKLWHLYNNASYHMKSLGIGSSYVEFIESQRRSFQFDFDQAANQVNLKK